MKLTPSSLTVSASLPSSKPTPRQVSVLKRQEMAWPSDTGTAGRKRCHCGLDGGIIDGIDCEIRKFPSPPSSPPPPWQSLGRPRCRCWWGWAPPRASPPPLTSTPTSRPFGCRPLPAAGSTTVVDWRPWKSIDLPRKLQLDFLTEKEEYVRHHPSH